jgi:hypothetical protein
MNIRNRLNGLSGSVEDVIRMEAGRHGQKCLENIYS